jgi:hypothetical protein
LAAAAHAAISAIHSVAHWPREARRIPDLGDLLYELVAKGLSALEDVPGEASGDAEADASVRESPKAA